MRTHRFFAPIDIVVGTSPFLPPEAAHHCAQVLRYKTGDRLTIFNGDGFDYLATIETIEKKQCQVKIREKVLLDNESPLKINLFQGIARGEKMDLIIQKSVELGVSEITPFFTERCNVKLDGKRLEKKLIHWNKIIISACEQSGRAVIPKLNDPTQITKLTAMENPSIYLEPTAKQGFSDLIAEGSVNLLIGPEGGFSEKDLEQLNHCGAKGVRIGPRILRTETAGLCAISVLQSQFGDL